MPKVKISKTQIPDPEVTEINIYPDGDNSLPKIGVLKIEKGKSNMTLDPGFLPYRSF